MAVNAGALNREFRLEKPSGLDSSSNEDMGTEWGSLRLAGGNELLRFGTPMATGAWVIELYYRDDLDASWRLVDIETGKSYQISNFGDPDGSLASLKLFCVEAQ